MGWRIMNLRAWLIGLLILPVLGPGPAAAQDETFQTVVSPFLKKHCYACHGPDKQESRLRLDQVTGVQAGNRNLWTMVHERIAAGEMPPKDRPQPTAAERNQALAWIARQQRALGAGGTRRLNRRELAASLADVTGLGIDFSAALPGDGTVGGFDTGADGLQEAADAVAQWLQVTRRAVDGIRFLTAAPGRKYSADLRETKDPRKTFDAWKADGPTARGYGGQGMVRAGAGLLLEPRAVGERETLSFTVPLQANRRGVLRLMLVVAALKPVAGLPDPHLWIEIGGKNVDYRAITATEDRPQRLVYEVHLGDLVVQTKGVSIHLSNKVEIPYAVEGFENEENVNLKDPVPGGTGLYRPRYDRRKLPPEQQPAPFVILQQIDIEPDVVLAWPPAAWRTDVGEIKDDPESARRLLTIWIERAWRRPVNGTEQAPFVKLYQKLRADGMSFDESLRAAFQSVLLSAPFRYTASPAHPDGALAQHAVASRLSYMLWGAPPDAELRRLAAAGKLRDPVVLDAQVDRLMADPRSQAFLRPFVTQWLELDQPITIAQDHIQKQDFRFARYLKASMREETIAYVAQLFAENRHARELVLSDWTMMNDTLARHYGYQDIVGGQLRKVKLRPDDPRGGGILGHAGIQSMLCWMGENWVIYRGAWTLRHILDQPPPPPPLEIPELNPSEGKNKGKPFRELLRQHQADARCAVCHKNIDPVGFAFQNFDLSGRWRALEYESYARGELDGRIAWRGVGKSRPVDSAGNLPRGESFKTFSEFKTILAKNYQPDLVRGLLKNFLIYGTGRLPGIDDMHEIASIMKDHRPESYPLRDLLKAVVRSRAFLEQHDTSPASQPAPDRSPP
jgi:mono/diheme cytochrome c family protein